uniref:Putative LOC100197594 [Hydra vulgaris] n=1 Tax=Lepeophtheirus salmonis TaxID=72036 RepID=A0A0K2USB7_LEPSM
MLNRSIEDIPLNDRIVFRSQNSVLVMVWVGFTFCRIKTPLIFIPEDVKVNRAVYLDMLRSQVLPWIQEQHWEGL